MNRSFLSPRRFFAAAALLTAFSISTNTAAHTTPEPAIQAHQMLGPDIWSQVIRLKNSDRKSRYPETLYATVFEFDNVLWLYTSTGTQPIERSRNRVDSHRNNLLPLLKGIDRGFRSISILPAEKEMPAGTTPAQLENGCVIESIYSLETARNAGAEIEKARLLLYSASRNTRRGVSGNARGHAVLIYQTPAGIFYVDPPEITSIKQFTENLDWDPKLLAATIERPYGEAEIKQAFFVPVNEPSLSLPTDGSLYSGDE